MTRALVTIHDDRDRRRIATWAARVPDGTRVEFKQTKRSIPQNDCMWSMLTAIASSLDWHGQRLSTDNWKVLFLDALNSEQLTVPNINGDGFVALGRSSSDLSKDEMSALIDLMAAFGAEHGVEFKLNESRS